MPEKKHSMACALAWRLKVTGTWIQVRGGALGPLEDSPDVMGSPTTPGEIYAAKSPSLRRDQQGGRAGFGVESHPCMQHSRNSPR